MTLSNSKVTKLGDRLRSRLISNDDFVLLDEFRQTFSDIDESAYTIIREALKESVGWTITKRKRKTQQSIVDKLNRQSKLRLPQMQDIAGCRIVLESGLEQALKLNALLVNAFKQQEWQVESKVRNAGGYRAVHIVAKSDKQFYEVQLRTYAQDIWANLVENMSDEKNTLKYGGNKKEQPMMNRLEQLSESFIVVDENAHLDSIETYQKQIEEAIRYVLSD